MRFELDSVVKQRNGNEWRDVQRATCGDQSVTGDGFIIRSLAKKLIEGGADASEPVVVYRGETQCFTPIPLGQWADGKAFSGKQPEHLRKV